MSSLFQRTMLYLGLAPEEEYDDLDAGVDAEHYDAPGQPRPPQPVERAPVEVERPSTQILASEVEQGAVRTIGREEAVAAGAKVTPITSAQGAGGGGTPSVRTFPVSTSRPHVVAPRQFNEAQSLADRFKADQAVILNLQEAERDLRRRLIDFASGLSYGLGGRMERVADGVYLLTPANVEVSQEDRQRLSEHGLHH
ncbi:MAG: cell division protein SepF [Actinomycetia bacterium]|nr:cell division protein SepF [Actinomycetes bacterium]MCP4962632.1 cell division protein SepF [Actinomycetes bacterium]